MMVKVCGISTREDAEAAAAAGAHALGFIFYPKSPRCVAPERAAEIGAGLDVLKVGVFVDEPRERVEEIARIARLDVAQLHGNESAADYPAGVAVWKAARVGAGFDLAHYQDCPAAALLLDGPASGSSFDWRIAAASPRPIVLAGGLDAENVAEAVRQGRPWGVDACSRLESAPGIKDHRKMIAFIQSARAALSC